MFPWQASDRRQLDVYIFALLSSRFAHVFRQIVIGVGTLSSTNLNRTVALIIRKTCPLWWFNWWNYGTEILLHAAPRASPSTRFYIQRSIPTFHLLTKENELIRLLLLIISLRRRGKLRTSPDRIRLKYCSWSCFVAIMWLITGKWKSHRPTDEQVRRLDFLCFKLSDILSNINLPSVLSK